MELICSIDNNDLYLDEEGNVIISGDYNRKVKVNKENLLGVATTLIQIATDD